MRILCLNYEYPPIGGGGGRAAESICEALVRRGHTVEVRTGGMRHLPPVETRRGVTIRRNRTGRRTEDTCSPPEMALWLAASIAPTLAHIRTFRPDVLHVHFAVPTGALAWMVTRLTRTPYLLTAHLGDVPGGVPEQTDRLFHLLGPLPRPIWKSASGVTAVSTFVAGLAKDAYGVTADVIPNGIPLLPRKTIHLGDPIRLVMVGRLSIQKNPVLAVQALAQIRDLPWTLDIVGDGPLRAELEHEIASVALTDRIRLHGWQNAESVQFTLAQSDIFLMPSRSEGMPVAAVEALNHGLAIVCSDIDGLRDIAHPTNAILCPQNPTDFATALRSLITDRPHLATLREASSQKAADFDIEKTTTAYESALESIRRRDFQSLSFHTKGL